MTYQHDPKRLIEDGDATILLTISGMVLLAVAIIAIAYIYAHGLHLNL